MPQVGSALRVRIREGFGGELFASRARTLTESYVNICYNDTLLRAYLLAVPDGPATSLAYLQVFWCTTDPPPSLLSLSLALSLSITGQLSA